METEQVIAAPDPSFVRFADMVGRAVWGARSITKDADGIDLPPEQWVTVATVAIASKQVALSADGGSNTWYQWPNNPLAEKARLANKDGVFELIADIKSHHRLVEHVEPILARMVEIGINAKSAAFNQMIQDLVLAQVSTIGVLKGAFTDLLVRYLNFKKSLNGADDKKPVLTVNRYGEPHANANNAAITIQHKIPGVFAYDLFFEDIFVVKPLPWLMPDDDSEEWTPRVIEEDDLNFLMQWLQNSELNVTITPVMHAVQRAAKMNAINTVKEDIEAVKWDGTKRLSEMMHTHFGCAPSKYNSFIGVKSMIGAVKRTYEPGCQFDTTLLLYSKDQGRNKTTAIKALFGEQYYGVLAGDYRKPDVLMKTRGKRVIDFSEMEVFTKREMRGANSWLTETEDDYRMPYGMKNRSYKRKFVQWGTTNTKQMLSDETGARRYWVGDVVGRCDVEAIKRDRAQLWAEALELYRAGERCYADDIKDEWFLLAAKDLAADHTEVGKWDMVIAAYLAFEGHHNGVTYQVVRPRPGPLLFTKPEIILREALGIGDGFVKSTDNKDVGKVLRKFGYESGEMRYGEGSKGKASGWLLRLEDITASFRQQMATVAAVSRVSEMPTTYSAADLVRIEAAAKDAARTAQEQLRAEKGFSVS